MKSERVLAAVAVAITALTIAAPTAQAGQRLYDFEEVRLDNGLRVITLEDFSCPIVAVQVWYHVGSKNESPDRQGFAHMFEHMMFRGTELLGPEGHFELIRRTGGRNNAFTSFDYTAYVETLPANQLELALWLEAERMMFLKVDDEGFQTERRVVEEERRQDLNEPYGTVFEKVVPVIFHEHPYRWTPIGNIPALRATQVWELQRFWDTYYVPANAALVVVGAVTHEEARDLSERYFGWMPAASLAGANIPAEPPQTEPRAVDIEEPIGPLPLAGRIYRGVPDGHEDYIPLAILMGVLGEGESSRLYQGLVRERSLCTQTVAEAYGL